MEEMVLSFEKARGGSNVDAETSAQIIELPCNLVINSSR